MAVIRDILQAILDLRSPTPDVDLWNSLATNAVYVITAAEQAAGVTPTNYGYPPGDVRRYGAKLDGTTDDTTAFTNALASNSSVSFPLGTALISSTLTIPAHVKLTIGGGLGNTSGSYPSSYFIKKSTMTTPALLLSSDCAMIEGGGLFCQGGNTGDGVVISSNSSILRNFLVHGAGGDGVRVGNSAGTNSNSVLLDHIVAENCGGNGITVHDGTAAAGANANVCTLNECFTHNNGGDGIHIGHAFWPLIKNCLSEVNTGYGLYLSGTANNTYPECRWATVVGGDYNESNTAGIIFDQSYYSVFIGLDQNTYPTTAGAALQGSGYRTCISGNLINSARVRFPVTQISDSDPNTLDDYEEGTWTPAQAGVSLTVSSAAYTKIGRFVHFAFDLTWPATADGTAINITGLTYAPINNSGTFVSGYTTYTNTINGVCGSSGVAMYNAGGVPSTQLTNANLTGKRIIGSGTYFAAT